MTDRMTKLEERVTTLEDKAQVKAGLRNPTLKGLLSAWPGGLKALARRVGYAPTSLTWLCQAKGEEFPVVMASKCAMAFQRRGLLVFEQSVTADRLRKAWNRQKINNT